MTLPLYTVSVAVHNNLHLTKACVASVLKHSHDYELLVTDNASADGTQHYLADLAAKHRHVRVLTNKSNLGFKEPQEAALRHAKGQFFVLLNNDMVVCEGWLEGLAKPFEDPKAGVSGVAGTCCVLDDSLQGRPLMGAGQPEYVEGSCLMIPTGLARRVGLFAPYLKFAYWEDTELSLRLRELGYKVAHVDLPMRHDQQGATTRLVPEVQAHYDHNTAEMKRRWGWYFKRRDLRRRILVRRLGANGDVLLATPALQALRERYPQAEIGLVTKCPQMVKGLGWLNVATKKRAYYDEFYDLDLAYEKRPDVHIVQAYADVLGVALPKRWQMVMTASEEDQVWAERAARGANLALLHAGPTNWTNKHWALEPDGQVDHERWRRLARALGRKGYVTATVGTDEAPELGTDLRLTGTTPQRLYALCREASLFVGIDSMCQHVASAADCPSVVLFGPTNPRAIVRPTPRIVVVQADSKQVECVGAHGRRDKPVTASPCDGSCLRAVSVEMVVNAVERVERLTQ